jgi:hypothetical protein
LGYEPAYQIPEQVQYWLSQEKTAGIVKHVSCDFNKSGFRLMTEAEWRGLGIHQSKGWIHYSIHKPEPHIILFRRPLSKKT